MLLLCFVVWTWGATEGHLTNLDGSWNMAGVWTAVGLAAIPAISALFKLVALLRARPSDIELDAHGFQVVGGRRGGLRIEWNALDRSGVRMEKCSRWDFGPLMLVLMFVAKYLRPRTRLVIKTVDGSTVTLAEATSRGETTSMSLLAEALRTTGTRAKAPATRLPNAAAPLHCTTCHAPLVPTDAPSVHCGHCGTANPMPADVRARVGHALTIKEQRSRLSSMISVLLEQPGLGRARLALAGVVGFVVGAVAVNAWYYATELGEALTAIPNAYSVRVMMLGTTPAIVGLAGAMCMSALLANRFAATGVIVGFGARRAATGELICQTCGGALPVQNDASALAKCAFCGVDNVLLGIELAGAAQAAEARGRGLEAQLQIRAQRRTTAFLAGILGAAIAMGIPVYVLTMEGVEHTNIYKSWSQVPTNTVLRMHTRAHDRRLPTKMFQPATASHGGLLMTTALGDLKPVTFDVHDISEIDGELFVTLDNAQPVMESQGTIRDLTSNGQSTAYIQEESGRVLLHISGGYDAVSFPTSKFVSDTDRPALTAGGLAIVGGRRIDREGEHWLLGMSTSFVKARWLLPGRMPAYDAVNNRVAYVGAYEDGSAIFAAPLDKKGVAPIVLANLEDKAERWPVFNRCGGVVFAAGDPDDDDAWRIYMASSSEDIVPLTPEGISANRPVLWNRGVAFELPEHDTIGVLLSDDECVRPQ